MGEEGGGFLSISLQCIVFFPSPWQVYGTQPSSMQLWQRWIYSCLGMSAVNLAEGGESRSPQRERPCLSNTDCQRYMYTILYNYPDNNYGH